MKVPIAVLRDPTLSDPAKLLYAEIRSYAWEWPDGVCFAAQDQMAADLGWSVSKVKRAAKELMALGLISCQVNVRGRSNEYRVSAEVGRQRATRQVASELGGRSPASYQVGHERPTKKKQRSRSHEEKREAAPTDVAAPAFLTDELTVRLEQSYPGLDVKTLITALDLVDDPEDVLHEAHKLCERYAGAVEQASRGKLYPRPTGETLLAAVELANRYMTAEELDQVVKWAFAENSYRAGQVSSLPKLAKALDELLAGTAAGEVDGVPW